MAAGLAAPTLMVGRERERAQLSALVADVASGRGRSVWIEGDPGIGKSELLAAGLAGASAAGCQVAWESADPTRQRFPLWVLMDALGIGPQSDDPVRAEIARLLRRGSMTHAVTAGESVAVLAQRLLLLVEGLCAAGPVVLVVDDLQWADAASLELWLRLHDLAGQTPLLLVGAGRPLPVRAEVTEVRNRIMNAGGVRIELPALSPTDQAVLVGHLVGGPPGPQLLRLVAKTGGNPLYLRELVDGLRRDQQLISRTGPAEIVELGDAASGEPPPLLAAIGRRLDYLSSPAVGMLRMAALLGAEFPLSDLAVVTGRPRAEMSGLVAESVAAGVLATSSAVADSQAASERDARLMFRHILMRQALYDAMPAALRVALHREAAQSLAAAGAEAEDVAGHLLAATDAADPWVVEWLAESAPALAHRAPQIAMELLERVLTAIDEGQAAIDEGQAAGDPVRTRLGVSLVTALFTAARYEDVARVARPLLARVDDPEVTGRVAFVLALAQLRSGRHDEVRSELVGVLRDRDLGAPWRARLLAIQANALVSGGRFAETESYAESAIAEGAAVSDPLAIGYALRALSAVRSRTGHDREALELLDRALATIGDAPEASDLHLLLLGNRASIDLRLGRAESADRAIGAALALAERTGSPQRLADLRLQAADQYYRTGHWDDALAEISASFEPSRNFPATVVLLHGLVALIAAHRDDRAASRNHLEAVADIEISDAERRSSARYLTVAQAVVAERDGRPEQALALLLSAFDEASDDDNRQLWTADIVRLAMALGDRVSADRAVVAAQDVVRPESAESTTAFAGHCRGLREGDASLVLSAARRHSADGHPLVSGQASENAAVLLAAAGDQSGARAAFADAVAAYVQLGAEWDLLRADARLRPYGVRRGVRGPRRRPATGWEALTPTELKIVALVAAGKTNPAIAAELFLSWRTVQTHVSHVLSKLQLHSRVDIAREVAQRVPPGP